MRKLEQFLCVAMWVIGGVYAGYVVFKTAGHTLHPERYPLQAAPWYLDLLISGVFTVVIIVVLFAVRELLKTRRLLDEDFEKIDRPA